MPFDDAGNAVCAEVDSAAAGDSSRCANHAGSAAAEKALRMTYVSVPLITGALLLKGEDTHFRNMRGEHIPKTYKRNETYIQYLPLAVTLGLKAFGVESRSSWARMAVSGAAGGAIMLAATQSMKHLISTGRPDNSDDHSFPSGHTATAFVTATILHREYGHLHPLVSIGGYTAAAATGILRIRKNRHWASDVAAGAGIGILATELGYCITDALFRNKGLDITGRKDIISNRGYKPSFVGIRTGFNVPLGNFRLNDMLDFRTSGGYCAAVEGAYFVNTHIGIGGKIGTASCNIITNGRQAEPDRLVPCFEAVACGNEAYGGIRALRQPVPRFANRGRRQRVRRRNRTVVHFPRQERHVGVFLGRLRPAPAGKQKRRAIFPHAYARRSNGMEFLNAG